MKVKIIETSKQAKKERNKKDKAYAMASVCPECSSTNLKIQSFRKNYTSKCFNCDCKFEVNY